MEVNRAQPAGCAMTTMSGVIARGRGFEPALSSKESAASKNFVLACSGFCEAKRVAKFAPGALE